MFRVTKGGGAPMLETANIGNNLFSQKLLHCTYN